MLRSEVLPAPFGPMIEAISPRRAENVTSSTARTPPNRLETAVAASRRSSEVPADAAVPPTTILPASSRKTQWRPMRRRYGWHDADAIARKQPFALPAGANRPLPPRPAHLAG